jgi:hypothetical protein
MDFILDESLNPYLLDMNMSPSLACDSNLEVELKVKIDPLERLIN